MDVRSFVCSLQSTQTPFAVEHDMLSGQVSDLSLRASAYQRMISNNSYKHDERGDIPWQENEGAAMSSINCDCC